VFSNPGQRTIVAPDPPNRGFLGSRDRTVAR
jgi:hypothetical protein